MTSLEQEVIELAPADVVAWNDRRMDPCEEPESFVSLVIDCLEFSDAGRPTLDRQKARFLGDENVSTSVGAGEAWNAPP